MDAVLHAGKNIPDFLEIDGIIFTSNGGILQAGCIE